ncbi:ribonuclease 3 [Bacterioplanes sanyensis]|uniref:ribonuclease III n=1 Tax=Bacterioplanes sanyensis TaxID=1249553 RepID=UPI00167A716D|nr:ribonuclease III [Bacterioplanes sanyensis]GGY45193.1 ribonuclease 3 [Bacterioplanes sanyensis]
MNDPLLKLGQRLGYEFADEQLATLALTHRSKGGQNNERLEFLGDSILSLIISEALFKRFPQAKEGKLTRLRSQLVRGKTLAAIAREFQLGEFLILGSSVLKSGEHRRESILADTVEALIGAIYMESGLEPTREVVLAWFAQRLQDLTLEDPVKDAKTRLQEYQQKHRLRLPVYDVQSVVGPTNEQVFTVSCSVPELSAPAVATGNSRRHAEQAAAGLVLEQLNLSSGKEESA